MTCLHIFFFFFFLAELWGKRFECVYVCMFVSERECVFVAGMVCCLAQVPCGILAR